MHGRPQRLLLLLAGAGLVVSLLLALLAPSLIAALPTQVRGRLPEEVLRAVTTPLPTALPLPLNVAAATPVSVAELLPRITAVPPTETTVPPTETGAPPTETAAPTETPVPAAPDVATATSSPTLLPTETPEPTSSPTPLPTPTSNPPLLPQTVRITGLEITPQKFNNCGSANMSVMLNYYGLPVSQTDISAVIKPQYDDRNVTPEELVAYVNEQTDLFAGVYRGGDLDQLRLLLQAGFPVIIEKGYEPDAWQGWMGHYLTLIGYDDEIETFLSLDTFLGPWDSSGRPISYEELSLRWAQFNNAFIVVYRPFDLQKLTALLGPAYLDEETMWQNAAARAETAVTENPEDAFAWFNLGMSLTRLADKANDPTLYSNAAAAFDQSRVAGLPPRMLWYQFEPYRAYIYSGRTDEALALADAVMDSDGGRHSEEAHFYQGLAYQEMGQLDLARNAFTRAVQMKPGFEAAQDMLAKTS